MARPSSLTPQAVVKALTSTPVAPSALASELGVSRATLHRKLKALEDEGLVTKVGQGPTATYRRWTPQDLVGPVSGSLTARWTLPQSTVFYVLDALDIYCRLGIGQLEQLEENLRIGSFGSPAEDREQTFDVLDKVKGLCNALKKDVLDFSQGASFGIHHPAVDPGVSRVWYLLKVLRHRLSWDRSPENPFGVGHDEPMFNDMGALVRVHSYQDTEASERTYVVDLDVATAHAAACALRVAAQIENRQYPALLNLFEHNIIKPRNPAPYGDVTLAHAQTLLSEIERQAQGLVQNETQTQKRLHRANALSELSAKLFEVASRSVTGKDVQGLNLTVNPQAPLSNCTVALLRKGGEGAPPESAYAAAADLPSSMALGWHGNECRVLDVESGCYIGRSHSVQTAIQLAHNYLQARRT